MMNFYGDYVNDDGDGGDSFIFCFTKSKDCPLNQIITRSCFNLGTVAQVESRSPQYQNQQHSEYDHLYGYEKIKL